MRRSGGESLVQRTDWRTQSMPSQRPQVTGPGRLHGVLALESLLRPPKNSAPR